ncbi:hypothetical protein [Tenacibaculum caenipelagi]|uniref:Uncharacterized protein n=1 Tax=Tenacibaculum caenipelagi TaxID=1325435 RepID=A0A4R6TEI8_9FLAO|nr:hypothetical protein [Tenacibaculum caenipelagi]TDQ25462.1 hypothetical protein DFQ07_1884 [Tenacibaculum caenipelagi]
MTLLISSLFYPAFYIVGDNPNSWSESWLLFFFGWTFPLGGAFLPFLIWCANPIYIFSIILTLKGKIKGLYFSLTASILGISFSLMETVMTSESGGTSRIKSLELGYKLWVSSLIVLTIGIGINELILKRK